MVLDVICGWLENYHVPYDIALARPYRNGVDWRSVETNDYSHLVFLCGPFGPGLEEFALMDRFAKCFMIGLNLSMVQPNNYWNPFDCLLERDGPRATRPDLAWLCEQGKAPVVGVCLVHPQPEYGERAMQKQANDALCRLLDSRGMAIVDIDTCLDPNRTRLRSPQEVESLIARMDVVVTTRLHGMVLALKNGIPVIAVDSIRGGAKVTRQAKVLGWSQVFTVDTLSDEQLRESFEYCLSETARNEARDCRDQAMRDLSAVRETFIEAIRGATVIACKNVVRPEIPSQNPLFAGGGYLLRKARGLARRVMRHMGVYLLQHTDDRGFRLHVIPPNPTDWRSVAAPPNR